MPQYPGLAWHPEPYTVPATEVVPAGHETGDIAPGGQYVPAAHCLLGFPKYPPVATQSARRILALPVVVMFAGHGIGMTRPSVGQ